MKHLARFAAITVMIFMPSLALSAAGKKQTNQNDRQKVVRMMAAELLAGLNPTKAEDQERPALSDQLTASAWALKQWWNDDAPSNATARKRKIAIWPFWKDKTVVADDFAEMLSDSLLAELIRNKGPNDTYVVREDLKILTQEIDDFNQLHRSSEKLGALMREAGADVLIIGEVKPDSDGRTIHVRYRASEVATGSIPATTDWHRLAYDFDHTPTISITEAIRRSTAYFRKRLPQIRTVRPQGIRYGDSGIHTPFGRWLASRLITEFGRFQTAAGRTMNVADAVISDSKVKTRGLKLAQKTADREMTDAPTGDYVLNGTYWLLGERVDLQIAMTDGNGNTARWQGDVRASSINLSLEPDKHFLSERLGDDAGPISLRIRSNRGASPVYRTGQKMILFIEASRDSYLYCFYRQADGSVMRVFPNRYHRDPFVPGGEATHVPGPSMAFDWIVEPPAGIEIMKCFAFDRDVTSDLPRHVRELDFKPLPYRSLAELSHDLRTLRRVGIAENSMIVNVEN